MAFGYIGVELILHTKAHMHFPASLLIVSDLMSGGQPSLVLFRAIKQPLAKNLDTDVGSIPVARVDVNHLPGYCNCIF